jgi:hypothetical protein
MDILVTIFSTHHELRLPRKIPGFLVKNIFFGGTGVETQGFTLAKQVLYHWSPTSSTFHSGYFVDGLSLTIFLGRPPDLSLSSS